MQTQLNYKIAQQHHAELIRNAEHARLAGEAGARRPARKPTSAFGRLWGRFTPGIATANPKAVR
ncbi:MAG TPA: hypothetical protein VMF57_02120 [Solirubrobacteraceae bacterium]|nr:hypothetical protein [Solirubrobacteraceae bacterium]